MRSRADHQRTEGVVGAAHRLGGALGIIFVRINSYIRNEYVNTYQEEPPPPMTEMGLQVRPTRAVTSCTAIPKRPRRAATELEPAVCTLWQHWMDPVLHWLEGPESVRRVGVAAARVATATVARAASLNCMMTEWREIERRQMCPFE
jgi:hypothetical protein